MVADRLIVGYDGGSTGADALAFGRRWGSASGTTPVVVTVHPGQTPLGPGRTDAEWNAYQREEAEALLAEARGLLGDAAEYRSVDASSPAHGLSDLVEAGDCVLVLGARRARGLRRTYPGSNAQRLLHGSASPVTIVPSDYAEREDTGLRRVTVAYLDTPDGQAALSAGARFARQLGADLEVLTVVPDTRRHAGEPSRFGTEQRADYQQALDRAVAAVDGVRATGRLADGPVVDTLVDIDAGQTDLLVCGSRDYGPVARVLLGGVSGRVVRHSRVPVTVVPRAR
jgi:nucleotide-binding universal stress UspA family protein